MLEKKTELGFIDMFFDSSILFKFSVILELIRIEKGSKKILIKFVFFNVMNVISKVKWDDDDEDLKIKFKLIFGKDDFDVGFIVKLDDMVKLDDIESCELKDIKMIVKFDVFLGVIYLLLFKLGVLEFVEFSERMLVLREGKKFVMIDDIFQIVLRKVKEIVDNKLMVSVEEDKNIFLDILSGEDNIEIVDMECDFNLNSQDVIIFQENDNFLQSFVLVFLFMIIFFKLFQDIFKEITIFDFGMFFKKSVFFIERKYFLFFYVFLLMDILLFLFNFL